MSNPTYQEILAEYNENARDLLVSQQEAENEDDYEIDAHTSLNQVGVPLENPEAFQEFGGNRGTEDHVIVPKPFVDNGKGSVRYSKDVKNNIFIIDTRFRSYAQAGVPATTASLITNSNYVSPILATATSLTSNFVFHIQRLVRNVMSATLTSLELPNNFFNLVDIRNNYFVYIRLGSYDPDIPIGLIGINASYNPPVSEPTLINIDNYYGVVGGGKMSIIFTEGIGSNILPNKTYYIYEVNLPSYPLPASITVVSTPTSTTPIIPGGTIGTMSQAVASYYTQVPVFITDINLTTTPVLEQQIGPPGQNGYYYSNTSIIPALNRAFKDVGIPDISVSYSNGHCVISNTSNNIYTLNFTPTTSTSNPQIFSTLGEMLGFNNHIYQLDPVDTTPPPESPCDFQCGQITSCQCYGTLVSEDPINMNSDPYIYVSIADWDNIRHQSINDSYFTAFARIPITVPKGHLIYDTSVNNTVTKKYHFLQPTNLQLFEIKLLDMNGNILLMPNSNWTMVLEMEEVLSQSLYEKLREL